MSECSNIFYEVVIVKCLPTCGIPGMFYFQECVGISIWSCGCWESVDECNYFIYDIAKGTMSKVKNGSIRKKVESGTFENAANGKTYEYCNGCLEEACPKFKDPCGKQCCPCRKQCCPPKQDCCPPKRDCCPPKEAPWCPPKADECCFKPCVPCGPICPPECKPCGNAGFQAQAVGTLATNSSGATTTPMILGISGSNSTSTANWTITCQSGFVFNQMSASITPQCSGNFYLKVDMLLSSTSSTLQGMSLVFLENGSVITTQQFSTTTTNGAITIGPYGFYAKSGYQYQLAIVTSNTVNIGFSLSYQVTNCPQVC